MNKEISNENQIEAFLHCGICMQEYKDTGIKIAPKDYSKLSIGWTPLGIQIWCDRHDCNVCHIDFEGQVHPANTSAKKSDILMPGEQDDE